MSDQLNLFGDQKRTQIGRATVVHKRASTLLNETSGFMKAYDYTLNPYSGCTFGCTYCYAAFFTRSKEKMDEWGYWLEVKENAIDLLRKKRRSPLRGVTIYMSSVTDPYQPIERELGLTRQILEEFIAHHEVRLVIQTRSPLVTRDIDLFKQFSAIQVNMTVTTDDETVRKAFEPLCPSNKVRLAAIGEIVSAGVPACITMTPLLPVSDAEVFATQLLDTGVTKFVVQPFHMAKGQFVRGTREAAREIIEAYGWDAERYEQVRNTLAQRLPSLVEGQDGFAPI